MVLWWYVCVCALDVDSNTFGARPPELPPAKRLRVVTISVVRLVVVCMLRFAFCIHFPLYVTLISPKLCRGHLSLKNRSS